jgi:hypothetical protein
MIKKIIGLINAIKVQAMVCIPSVLEKVSILRPNKNENSKTKNGAVSKGNNKITDNDNAHTTQYRTTNTIKARERKGMHGKGMTRNGMHIHTNAIWKKYARTNKGETIR